MHYLMEKSKRDTTQRIKLFSTKNALEHLEKKKFNKFELGIDKVCQCILEWKKVKEIQWKE